MYKENEKWEIEIVEKGLSQFNPNNFIFILFIYFLIIIIFILFLVFFFFIKTSEQTFISFFLLTQFYFYYYLFIIIIIISISISIIFFY